MPEIGYALSSEEHTAEDLISHTSRAEDAGFEYALISDHFHPWVSQQGHSPFVWSTLGGIARETESIEIGTGVTCPIKRIHPVNVAQAAATIATMMGDRFFLGVGTGENLNEHVVGGRWPPFDVRIEMLGEAIEIIRELWTGEEQSYYGDHFTVENARLFTVPDDPPPVHVAAAGERAASFAGDHGDGLISTSPNEDVVEAYSEDGDGPTYGQMTVCWAESDEEARERAYDLWPNGGFEGELSAEVPTVEHFEQLAEMVDEDDVAESITASSDPDDHIEAVQTYADAGFDHVYVHQVGPDQSGFFEIYEEEVLPSFS